MLKLRNGNTDDEMLLLLTAATAGEPVDPEMVLSILDRLFATAEYDDHDEYIINTTGVVPKELGPERDKMWTWIERIEKRLGIEVEVWGSNGEYLTPTTLNGRTYRSSDFGSEENFRCVERDLAASFRDLVEFHRAWRMFASSGSHDAGGE